MNNVIFSNGLRFVVLVFVQVLLLQRISLGGENFNYVQVILYPIFLLLLPLRIPHPLLVFFGFLIGISIDIFYDSIGIHASASVFTAYIRPYVLASIAPRGGYNLNYSPNKHYFGINWFFIYACMMMFAHLFFYFSVEAFTFVYIVDIFISTVASFIVSLALVIIYQYLFDPKD